MNGTVYREMQDAEFDEKQAGTIDHAIRDGQAELATKADLATFEQCLGDKLDARFVGIETNLAGSYGSAVPPPGCSS